MTNRNVEKVTSKKTRTKNTVLDSLQSTEGKACLASPTSQESGARSPLLTIFLVIGIFLLFTSTALVCIDYWENIYRIWKKMNNVSKWASTLGVSALFYGIGLLFNRFPVWKKVSLIPQLFSGLFLMIAILQARIFQWVPWDTPSSYVVWSAIAIVLVYPLENLLLTLAVLGALVSNLLTQNIIFEDVNAGALILPIGLLASIIFIALGKSIEMWAKRNKNASFFQNIGMILFIGFSIFLPFSWARIVPSSKGAFETLSFLGKNFASNFSFSHKVTRFDILMAPAIKPEDSAWWIPLSVPALLVIVIGAVGIIGFLFVRHVLKVKETFSASSQSAHEEGACGFYNALFPKEDWRAFCVSVALLLSVLAVSIFAPAFGIGNNFFYHSVIFAVSCAVCGYGVMSQNQKMSLFGGGWLLAWIGLHSIHFMLERLRTGGGATWSFWLYVTGCAFVMFLAYIMIKRVSKQR